MKRFIFNLIALFILSIAAAGVQAQTPMTKGVNVIQAGVGLGGWTTSYTTSETPLIIATFERGVMDDLGKGNLSVGGTVLVKSGKYAGDFYSWNYTYTAVAARGSYHPHFVKSEKLDAYAGISLGLYHISTKATNGEVEAGVSGTSFAWGLHIGARYNFTDQIGAWAEVGAGVGNIGVGVSYRF
ncbi:MAG: outer membrane beta-barrel protein [Bacteroidota bacterium]